MRRLRRRSDGVRNRKRFEEMSLQELSNLIQLTEKRLSYLCFLVNEKSKGE